MKNTMQKEKGMIMIAALAAAALLLTGAVAYFLFPALSEAPVVTEDEGMSLGANTVKPIAGSTYYLAGSGVSSSDTSITVTSFTIPQSGYEIQDSDLSDTFYITLESGSRSRQEIASCTTVTQSTTDTAATFSGCVRGLSPLTDYTSSTTLAFSHSGGSSVIFSNPPQLHNQYSAKDNDEMVTGSWTFPTPTSGSNAATKDYVDSVVNGGNVSYDRTVVAGTGGETVATGTIVYLNRTNSRWYKSDNDLSNTYVDQVLGITQGSGSSGVAISGGVLTYGLDSTQVGMTGGNFIFLSATAGATSTATTSQILGKAISATSMFFDQNLIDSSVYVSTTFVGTTTFVGATIGVGSSTVRVITASSTWTEPTSLKHACVEMVGGGGDGGNTDANDAQAAGGGGSGAYARFCLSENQLPSSVFVQIGASATNTTIGNINSTIFTGFATATAGTKGANSNGSGGGSNGGSGGTLTSSGLSDFIAINGTQGSGGLGVTTVAYSSGSGASNPLGFGGGGVGGNSGTQNGNSGTGYGSGGSGGGTSAAASGTGGSGKNGVVIITEYY